MALPGMTDTHFHIFGPTDKYPLSPKRMYDPPLATVADYHAMATTLGIERMVIVQASIYGTDNSCLLDSIAQLGKRNTRGIAVVDQSITMEELKNMDAIGVRGIRFNAITGRAPIQWLPSLAHIIEPLGWHIQLWIKSARLLEYPVCSSRSPFRSCLITWVSSRSAKVRPRQSSRIFFAC